MYTDASKYAWSCVLTQEYDYEIEGKIKQIYHPITYASGLCKGSQVYWATLTKEAYTIYMSGKKLDYYLQDAEITLRSDHLPLKKFLEKKTLNVKVNNWAVEISPYKIKFEYIKGIKNTLADTMSRLIKNIPDTKPLPEPEGYEFGYYAFEELDPISTGEDTDIVYNIQQVDDQAIPNDSNVDWGFTSEEIKKAQSVDKFCTKMLKKLVQGRSIIDQAYHVKDGILRKYVTDNKQRFDAIVVPVHYTLAVLRLAHDDWDIMVPLEHTCYLDGYIIGRV